MNLSHLTIDRLFCIGITIFMPFFDFILVIQDKDIKVPLVMFTIACGYGLLLLISSYLIKYIQERFIYFLYMITVFASLAVLQGIFLNHFGTVHLLGGLTALSLFAILFRHEKWLLAFILFFNVIFSIMSIFFAPENLNLLYVTIIFWVVGITSYITTTIRIRSYNEVHHLAYHDYLTDLPNSRKFSSEMDLLMNQDRFAAAAVLFIDLNHFKSVNDKLGHRMGDKLLQMVAERLRNCAREGDMIARLGGDEFVVFLPNTESTEVQPIAQNILHFLSEPYDIQGNPIIVTPSIGISIYPEHGHTVKRLIKHADFAMYLAKDQRRHPIQVYSRDAGTKSV